MRFATQRRLGPRTEAGFAWALGPAGEGGIALTVAHRRERFHFSAKLEVGSHALAHPHICRVHCELDMLCLAQLVCSAWPSLCGGFMGTWDCRERFLSNAQLEVSCIASCPVPEGTHVRPAMCITAAQHPPCHQAQQLPPATPDAHARPYVRSWARQQRLARAWCTWPARA